MAPRPDTRQSAIRQVAILGGDQNRSRDPPPGHPIRWRGLERMALATLGYEIRDDE